MYVQWDPLPKTSWNGKLLGYIVSFRELQGTGSQFAMNQTVYGETSNITRSGLKHFTNYSVTVMAFNRVGVSSPTSPVNIETLEHG